MTPHEARLRVCPMGQPHPEQVIRCCADSCRAWRWHRDPGEIFQNEDGLNTSLPDGDGYCGMAGR